jgi:hypothetical protein
MNHLIKTCRNEQGSVIIFAFILLVVLTLLGIFATRTATIDIRVASNEIPYKQNFYIAEGGVQREAAEVARGSYAIANVKVASNLATWNVGDSTAGLPAPVPHEVNGTPYNFEVDYLGFFPPPAGYSILHFSRYDYQIQAAQGSVQVRARYFKIGPKAE